MEKSDSGKTNPDPDSRLTQTVKRTASAPPGQFSLEGLTTGIASAEIPCSTFSGSTTKASGWTGIVWSKSK